MFFCLLLLICFLFVKKSIKLVPYKGLAFFGLSTTGGIGPSRPLLQIGLRYNYEFGTNIFEKYRSFSAI